MNDLIKALTILCKYGDGDAHSPSHCEHDVFMLAGAGVNPDDVSEEDLKTLEDLGFMVSSQYGEKCFMSFRFGSC